MTMTTKTTPTTTTTTTTIKAPATAEATLGSKSSLFGGLGAGAVYDLNCR